MAGLHSQRLGVSLVVAAAVAWSTAPFFTRLLQLDSWTILFWRGLFGGGLGGSGPCPRPKRAKGFDTDGKERLARRIALDVGHGQFHPGPAADQRLKRCDHYRHSPIRGRCARLDMASRSRPMATMLASVAALCGVAIIVGNARASSDVLGIALTCLMTVAIAAMTVIVREHKNTPMVAAPAWSNLLGSVISIPFANAIASVAAADLVVLAMFGFFQVALGLSLFVLGSRLLPSGQATLIATLETPLMPFWVWVAFQEIPAPRALLGGALVMGAVIADIVGDTPCAEAMISAT